MRALTLHQPYASALAIGLKRIETRGWSTAYRGPVVIHAALAAGPEQRARWAAMPEDDRAAFVAAGHHFFKSVPLGRPVAVAQLVNVITVETLLAIDSICLRPLTDRERRWGDYTPGRFAWIFEDIRPVKSAKIVTGYQGLWHWRGEAPQVVPVG